MRHEIKRICKIVDELTTLLLKNKSGELDFKIITQPDKSIIRFTSYNTTLEDAYIDHLRLTFNRQRQMEIEENYWMLAGETDEDDEITLVGAMVDSAIVEKREGNLFIELVRFNI